MLNRFCLILPLYLFIGDEFSRAMNIKMWCYLTKYSGTFQLLYEFSFEFSTIAQVSGTHFTKIYSVGCTFSYKSPLKKIYQIECKFEKLCYIQ